MGLGEGSRTDQNMVGDRGGTQRANNLETNASVSTRNQNDFRHRVSIYLNPTVFLGLLGLLGLLGSLMTW